MSEILYDIQRPPASLRLGNQGEGGVTTLIFDCAAWLDLYPGSTLAATIRLPGSLEVAPQPVDIQGTLLRILVTRSLTHKAGQGSLVIKLLDGPDRELRSVMIQATVEPSHPPATGEMPDMVADWVAAAQVKLGEVDHFVDETIDATEAANAAALRAENGEDAREQAEGLRVIAEQGRQDAYVIAEEARDGLYEAAEIARGELFESAETTRNTQSGEAADRANAIAGALEGIAPLWSDVDISVSALGEGAAPTASITQDGTGTSITLGIPKGDTGAQGDKGNDGKPFTYRGDYNAGADPLYTKNDVVRFGGGSFVYINDVESNEPTSSTSHWQQIAEKGLKGDAFVYADFTPEQLALLVGDPTDSMTEANQEWSVI